jgi:hypothetical protein
MGIGGTDRGPSGEFYYYRFMFLVIGFFCIDQSKENKNNTQKKKNKAYRKPASGVD